LTRWSADPAAFAPAAVAEYIRRFSDPATIHATCEDYRASATIDLRHDEADMGQKVSCPLLVLWGEWGFVGRRYDVLATWRKRASDVRGTALPGGRSFPRKLPKKPTRRCGRSCSAKKIAALELASPLALPHPLGQGRDKSRRLSPAVVQ
jgi:hypothetical protein